METIKLIIILALLFIAGLLILNYFHDPYLEYNDVKILKSDYEKLNKLSDDNVGFKVCSIESGNCIEFINFESAQKYFKNLE